MAMGVRFFDQAGDQVGQFSYTVKGESAGWKGDLERSTFTHRRETVTVPPKGASVWVVLSSAGPPETLGLYTIEGLSIARLTSGQAPEILSRWPSAKESEASSDAAPAGWMVDGIRPSMAKVMCFGRNPQSLGLSIVDDNAFAHAEWHTTRQAAPKVSPGEQLVVEWNEVFTIGQAQRMEISYPAPPPGTWRFRVESVDILGHPCARMPC